MQDTKMTRDNASGGPLSSGRNSAISVAIDGLAKKYEGTYDSGFGWTWADLTSVLVGLGARVMSMQNTYLYNINVAPGLTRRMTSLINVGQHLVDWAQNDNSGPEDTWRNNLATGINYALAKESATSNHSVRSLKIGSELVYSDGFPLAEEFAHYWGWIRGLLEGTQIQFVDCSVAAESGVGYLHVAEDGFTFETRALWKPGICDCVNLTDGDAMIWMPRRTAGFNEILRYDQNGFRTTDYINLTGNWWTGIMPLGGQFDIYNMCVVYSG